MYASDDWMPNKEDTVEPLGVCNIFSACATDCIIFIISGNGVMKLSSGVMFVIVVSHSLH